jgi:N-methylhydantoinase A
LRVGPESAGADPGPACYGRSVLPTVTDAHVVLGHFGGAGLLGGEFPLDEQRARAAISLLAAEMSEAAARKVSMTNAAQGVIFVVNTNMERALRSISVERGYDPREFALLPFGGAGGLHAIDLARALRIPRVIAPTSAGALSAIGVVIADVVKDLSRTVMLEVTPGIDKKLETAFRDLERTAANALRKEGFPDSKVSGARSLAVRYKGQSFELNIAMPQGSFKNIVTSFHRAHRARYGYAQESGVVEIVSTKLRSIGVVEKFRNQRISSSRSGTWAKPHSSGIAYFDGTKQRVGIYRRDDLGAGMKLRTPCIVTEYSATTLIPTSAKANIDRYGNLIIVTNE